MRKCSAWELWRVQNQVADVLVIVNLKPMEGLPVFGRQVNSRISVYFQEEDLKEYLGQVNDLQMAQITKEYIRIRNWNTADIEGLLFDTIE